MSTLERAYCRMENSTVIRLVSPCGFLDGYYAKYLDGQWHSVDIDEMSMTVRGDYGIVSDSIVAETMESYHKNGFVDTLNLEIFDPSLERWKHNIDRKRKFSYREF